MPIIHNFKFSPQSLVRHVKTGNVYIVRNHCVLEYDLKPAYIYQLFDEGIIENTIWVREAVEFEDGRFISIEQEGY